MDFKEELGQKIQTLREERGLSRQAICGLEDVLTTRQLQRIEKGQSLPTIATAMYIADQLGVSLDVLASSERLELPRGYVDLRYRLRTLYHYGDPERLQQREQLLDDIYVTYFDSLPEEEQIAIQVTQAGLDMIQTENASFDQGLLDEYLEQAIKKTKLSYNDIDILQLRMLSLALGNFEKEEFMGLLTKIIASADYSPLEELVHIQNVILAAAGVLSHYEEYEDLPLVMEVLEKIMTKRNDFQDRIFIYALQWKIDLFLKDNYKTAEENYQRVLLFADLLGEEVVKENMKKDWAQDQERYQQFK